MFQIVLTDVFVSTVKFANRCILPTVCRGSVPAVDQRSDGQPSAETEQRRAARAAGENVLYEGADQAMVQRIHGNYSDTIWIITCAKEIMFSLAFVYLSVCLSGC